MDVAHGNNGMVRVKGEMLLMVIMICMVKVKGEMLLMVIMVYMV